MISKNEQYSKLNVVDNSAIEEKLLEMEQKHNVNLNKLDSHQYKLKLF